MPAVSDKRATKTPANTAKGAKISMAARAHTVFPAGRFVNFIKKNTAADRVSPKAAIVLARAMDVIANQLADDISVVMKESKKNLKNKNVNYRLSTKHLSRAIEASDNYGQIFDHRAFAGAGVAPTQAKEDEKKKIEKQKKQKRGVKKPTK